jgi:hypothetical protein
MLSFKMNVMLAQAQECVLEKSIIDNRKTSINAKISCQIIEFYQIALVNIEKPQIQKDVDSKMRKVILTSFLPIVASPPNDEPNEFIW